MKKISLFFLFSGISIFSNAQEVKQEKAIYERTPISVDANKEVKLETGTKSVTMSISAGESQVIHNDAYYQKKIAQIDAQISAINTKISIVNADAQEKSIANNSGWFADMENIKTELENQKFELQSHLN